MLPSELSSCCFFHNQNNSTSSPGLLGNGALTCSGVRPEKILKIGLSETPHRAFPGTQLIHTCILLSSSQSLVIRDSRAEVPKIHDSPVFKTKIHDSYMF